MDNGTNDERNTPEQPAKKTNVVALRPSAAAAIMGNPAAASQAAEEMRQEPGNPVEDLQGFMTHLVNWQQLKLARLRHMAKIPAGNDVEITDDKTGESKKLVLEGDILEAFKLGVRIGIAEISQLPFAAETEDEPAANEAGDQKPEQPSSDEPTGPAAA